MIASAKHYRILVRQYPSNQESHSPQCLLLLKLVTYFYKSSNRTFLVQGIRWKKEKRYKLPTESLRGRALAVPKRISYTLPKELHFLTPYITWRIHATGFLEDAPGHRGGSTECIESSKPFCQSYFRFDAIIIHTGFQQ
ncbi:hypothetical protein NPIL_452481 [Nephila pilipes]|uniref:Uncharacterized protein n=1 Tax=Nephila pilipes TaxID=299642 RepID=A0A8X6TZH3_NEPPI|nr:hypothetical protein NPIL_452481 [Nephila pilipes]